MDGFKSFKKIQCFKEGGQVGYKPRKSEQKNMHEDVAEDKKLIKKAFKQHDKAKHEGADASEIKLKKGGRAKKDCGTVTKYCGGGGVKGYSAGKMVKQAGATEAQQKYYQANMEEADKKAAKKDYELIGSRGDAARKGMEEGRMDAMGTAFKKGGKACK